MTLTNSLTILVCFFFSIQLCCQSSTGGLEFEVSRISSTYFSFINKAELAIVEANYTKAKKLYDKAFKTIAYQYSDDIFNALKVSEILDDTLNVKALSQELMNRGLCLEFFEDIPAATNLSKSPDINRNEKFRFELEDLHISDQEIRYNNASRKEIRRVDSLNYLKFLALVDTYGYPNVINIGIECSSNNKGIAPQPLSELLVHFAQHQFADIDSTLRLMLNNHAINPYQYGYHMGNKKRDIPFYATPIVRIEGKYYTYRHTKPRRKEINRKRQSYGMASIEDQIKKIRFRLANTSGVNFRFYTSIDQYNGLAEDLVKKHFVEYDLLLIK